MSDLRSMLEHELERLSPPRIPFDQLARRRDRKRRDQRIRAGALGLAVAIAVGWLGVNAIRSTPSVPADDRSEDLGIFAPAAGRIVFQNHGYDRGYDPGLWAVDPSAPSVSSMVRLGPEGDLPLGWANDGTELLFVRENPDAPYLWRKLFILHADGSETQLDTDSRYIEGATIAPDGSRVIFAAAGGPYFPYNDVVADPGLFVVDTDGGRPVPIPYPSAGDRVYSPTFSPDGTQIAYRVLGFGDDDVDEVWLADADGGNAHEILADEPAVAEGVTGIAWSPAGDRIAMWNSLGRVLEIYTFAPDGSDFRTVITGGMNPFWSPDGSQIAYVVPKYDPPRGGDPPGLAIADADGSNVRAFGFAASGPWHPGVSAPAPVDTPTPMVWSPVVERDASAVHRGDPWLDPDDAPVGWVDVQRLRFSTFKYTNGDTQTGWSIGLAAKPPLPADRESGLLIAYGLVLDTTGDGVADYVVGIDNDAPERGDFHVWVTDLATGETNEQIGPPYGVPIDFSHPDEAPRLPVMTFFFLAGSAPADLNPESVRFYAWASAAIEGEVFASDYAPDTGWARP